MDTVTEKRTAGSGSGPELLAELMNIHQAAEFTGYKSRYLYKLVERGKLRAHRPFGATLIFFRSELIEDLTRNGRAAL